jgi:F-box/WD-40 domain protein 7
MAEECAISNQRTFFAERDNDDEDDEIHYSDENTGTEISITQTVVSENNVEIQLETPLETTHCISMTTNISNAAESSNVVIVKPKRLSDEFLSIADDESEDNDDDDQVKLDIHSENSTTTTTTTQKINSDIETIGDEVIVDIISACCSKESSIVEENDIDCNDLDENSLNPPYLCDKIETVTTTSTSSSNSNSSSSSNKINKISSLCFGNGGGNNSNNLFVQSLASDDAIERADFEAEQKLTGGIIIRASSLSSGDENRLNFDLLSDNGKNGGRRRPSNSNRSVNSDEIEHEVDDDDDEDEEIEDNEESSIVIDEMSASEKSSCKHNNNSVLIDASSSSASSETLTADARNDLTTTPTSSRCNASNSNKSTIRSSSAKQKLSDKYLSVMKTSTSSSSCSNNSNINNHSADDSGATSSSISKLSSSSASTTNLVGHSNRNCMALEKNVKINLFSDEPSTSSASSSRLAAANNRSSSNDNSKEDEDAIDCLRLNEGFLDNTNPHDLTDELDPDETWADCEEGSESEEICTCRNDTDDEYGGSCSSSEDELPSRDVDLSSYTQLDPISDDILQETCEGTPKIQRKRKLTEQSSMIHVTESPIALSSNRKRMALDAASSHSLLSPMSSQNLATTPKSAASMLSDKRTPRLIPTKENPPPELMEWLLTFQRWTNAERLVAVDKLIEQCEPTQVRHMMKVIEPQFQRDFISLLPKELALHVLSYLEPKDLLRAAQTCTSWRFLADDNLLWKDKCKHAAIISETHPDKPKRGRTGNMPKIASPWKAAYMRHHTIELNWRSNLIRPPKILNGHDDHVITCLQFCGNRIVSGSDDNTLKVWSAVTGKCLRTLVGHTGGVWSSQMSGNLIISGSTDRTLKVWEADSGLCKHTLYGHTSTVRCMHLHGNK